MLYILHFKWGCIVISQGFKSNIVPREIILSVMLHHFIDRSVYLLRIMTSEQAILLHTVTDRNIDQFIRVVEESSLCLANGNIQLLSSSMAYRRSSIHP